MFTDDELSSLINVRRDEKPWNLLIFMNRYLDR
jgi:hypothetical protein